LRLLAGLDSASADGDSTRERNDDIDVDRVIDAVGEEESVEGIAGEMVESPEEDTEADEEPDGRKN
jgi:hypothetical protein